MTGELWVGLAIAGAGGVGVGIGLVIGAYAIRLLRSIMRGEERGRNGDR